MIGRDLAIVTDVGKRHARNEDAGAIALELVDGAPAFVLVVCDGVSTSSFSDRLAAAAAAAARAALVERLRAGPSAEPESGVADAIQAAHHAACSLNLEMESDKDPPGATIVAAVAQPGRISVGWLGDSRAYWVSARAATLLTHDDSWMVEVVDDGELSEEQARSSPNAHAITHCIGPLEGFDRDDPSPAICPHTRTFRPPPGGTLVLCSDGLWNYASDPDKLAALVRSVPPGADAAAVARTLVEYALDRGGVDNVTVAVARLP